MYRLEHTVADSMNKSLPSDINDAPFQERLSGGSKVVLLKE